MDKLQEDLDEANATKVNLEDRTRVAEVQVAELQWQVEEMQAQAQDN